MRPGAGNAAAEQAQVAELRRDFAVVVGAVCSGPIAVAGLGWSGVEDIGSQAYAARASECRANAKQAAEVDSGDTRNGVERRRREKDDVIDDVDRDLVSALQKQERKKEECEIKVCVDKRNETVSSDTGWLAGAASGWAVRRVLALGF